METKPIGLYVHVPFCKRKCNYCDFCSTAANDEKISLYVDNLIKEIESYSVDKISVDTVFFGGGTPSCLSPLHFRNIVESLRSNFDLTALSEFTVECNPGTLNEEKLQTYKDLGVNRISLGVQSIHENELKILGRIHTYDDFLETYKMVLEKGFTNINLDVMYGIPDQTKESFMKTLKTLITLSPTHISCYGLIIEEGTPFYRMKENLSFPSEDEECDMYDMAHKFLTEQGYDHYEISNYAKENKECAHNLKYWHDEEYLGIGIASHSYYNGKRFFATESFDEYFDSFGAKYRKTENHCETRDPFEYAMLALRLKEGMSLLEYREQFGMDFFEINKDYILKCIDLGYMGMDKDRVFLTHKGFYVSNTILAELL